MAADNERGYALVAAVTAVAAFAFIAFQVLGANQGAIALLHGRIEQARLTAAADAGIALAIHGLATEDRTLRWSIDGRARQLDFNGVALTMVVEDERGKAPLAGLNDSQARALFSGAGASGDQLDALVTEFRAWQTEEDPEGSNQELAAAGQPVAAVRHGPFRTIGELAALKDMDGPTFARIAPVVTVFFEQSGGFEPRYARPLAAAAMAAEGGDAAEQVVVEDQSAEQRPDEEIASNQRLIGRTLTVRAVAHGRDGAQAHRTAIIELTGGKAQPYWIRYVE